MHVMFLVASLSAINPAGSGTAAAWSTEGRTVPLGKARHEFEALERLDSVASRYSDLRADMRIQVVEGDLTVRGTLARDWEKGQATVGLLVTGNLTVHGSIVNRNLNGGPFLLVLGETRAHAIIGGGAELSFLGDAHVEEIVVGEYNDGILRFGGRLTVPVAVTNDHHFEVAGGVQGRWLDPFNEGHRWSAVLHPGIAVATDDEGSEEIDVMQTIVPRLLAGQPVLRPDLPPLEDYPELFE